MSDRRPVTVTPRERAAFETSPPNGVRTEGIVSRMSLAFPTNAESPAVIDAVVRAISFCGTPPKDRPVSPFPARTNQGPASTKICSGGAPC